MKIVHKKGSQADIKQSGFVILMGLLVLILGAAAWYGSMGNVGSEKMKASEQKAYVVELERIKERMLTYAVLNPELFDDSVSGTEDISIPGPGYFPCPDIDGDGITDTGTDCTTTGNLYAMGWIPQRIFGRSFSFLPSGQEIENKRYWFATDARFLVDGEYQYSGSTRFAPLNINTPSLVDPLADPTLDPSPCDETTGGAISAGCVPPLTLDGRGNIVMVLFYAGEADRTTQNRTLHTTPIEATSEISEYLEQPSMVIPSSSINNTSTGTFISQSSGSTFFNDYAIAITRDEWNAAVLSRVTKDIVDINGNPGSDGIPDLCSLPDPVIDTDSDIDQKNSWFNECTYDPSSGEPPYPCKPISAVASIGREDNEETLWAGWFSGLRAYFSGGVNASLSMFSDWKNIFGLNQLWSMMGGMGGMGGGGGSGGSLPPENIEGQNWRAVLECP